MRHPLHAPRREAPPLSSPAARSPGAGLPLQIPALPMAARRQAWQFAAALVFFHGSEYVLAAAFHGRRNVTATLMAMINTRRFSKLYLSFGEEQNPLLISKQYVLAMSFAMLEHLTEALLFPELKEYWFVSNVGLLMVIIGEIIRKLAVVTAGRAFTHVIRIYHEDQHQLVTNGVYRVHAASGVFWFSYMGSRDPSYAVQPSIYCCICIGVMAILFKTDTVSY
ncbi:hypothetical protein ACP4OV_026431 [Aristida adscensionis]